jgi:hypothetical protein
MTIMVAAMYGRTARRGIVAVVRVGARPHQIIRAVGGRFVVEVAKILGKHGREQRKAQQCAAEKMRK